MAICDKSGLVKKVCQLYEQCSQLKGLPPCALVAAHSTSDNTASPKLPQFMDCVRWVEMKRNGGLSDSENAILLEMHNFIERQLQA
jgi:hypothetical protein